MSESTLKLIELIKHGKTANEMAQELNISSKQLFNRLLQLKNIGFDFQRKYYYNGDIVYSFYNDVPVPQSLNSVDIITVPEEQEFEAVVISDLHIGSVDERLDMLDKIYDYCIQNNIHTIFNAGDIVDGMIGKGEKKQENIMEQINYMLRVYPFDKSILNYAVLGNHDINCLFRSGQDLATVLRNYRHDIIPVGYGTAQINIKNDKIVLKHPLVVSYSDSTEDYNDTLIIRGHQHKMSISYGSTNCIVCAPTLSNIIMSENAITGAIKIKLYFEKGFFKLGYFDQLMITDKVFSINSMLISLNKEKKNLDEVSAEVKYEEKRKVLTLDSRKGNRISQIDKFNARYGLK